MCRNVSLSIKQCINLKVRNWVVVLGILQLFFPGSGGPTKVVHFSIEMLSILL